MFNIEKEFAAAVEEYKKAVADYTNKAIECDDYAGAYNHIPRAFDTVSAIRGALFERIKQEELSEMEHNIAVQRLFRAEIEEKLKARRVEMMAQLALFVHFKGKFENVSLASLEEAAAHIGEQEP